MTIEIVEFSGRRISIAYTDYSKVYISDTLAGQQRKTAIKHEKGHIWLQHQNRGLNLDRKLWNIAADLEIAKQLYTEKDIDAINEPRSSLAGGITKEHCEKYPLAEYAEEFYQELLKERSSNLVSHDGDANDQASEGQPGEQPSEQPSEQPPEELVKKAKEKADKEDEEADAAASLQQQQRSIQGFAPPKPSLASLIDRHIGRSKVSRAQSYARPSRRQSSDDMILRGHKAKPKTPRITVYVDRSGSFNPDKTAQSMGKLAECLLKYRGRAEYDVLYFADHLMHIDPCRGSGGTNYQPVVDQIAADQAEISVIITDEDSAEGVRVPTNMPAVIVVPIGCSSTSIGTILRVQHAQN